MTTPQPPEPPQWAKDAAAKIAAWLGDVPPEQEQYCAIVIARHAPTCVPATEGAPTSAWPAPTVEVPGDAAYAAQSNDFARACARATAAPGLREAITDAIWTLQDKISSEDAKAFEGVLLAAITPAFAKLEADNAALRKDLERFTGGGMLDAHAICDQRDALRTVCAKKDEALRGVINTACHPDVALRSVLVELAPIRAALALTPEGVRDELAASKAEVERLVNENTNEIDCRVANQEAVMRLESALAETRNHLTIILPMAKGYAAEHPVGNNQAMVNAASEHIDNARRTP